MKRIAFLSIATLIVSLIWGDAKIQIDKKGYLHEIELSTIQRDLTVKEKEAIENPGQEILIKGQIKPAKRINFLYLIPKVQYNEAIIYNKSDNRIETIPKITIVEGEKTLLLNIVFLLLGIGLMVCSNLLIRFANYAAIAIATATATAAAIAAAASLTTAAALAAALTTATATAAALTAVLTAATATATAVNGTVDNEMKKYKVLIAIFYITAILALFI
ncbi:MAG: hypothetical protein ABH884_04420 [Candidatus Komeilibacteria bacterium]